MDLEKCLTHSRPSINIGEMNLAGSFIIEPPKSVFLSFISWAGQPPTKTVFLTAAEQAAPACPGSSGGPLEDEDWVLTIPNIHNRLVLKCARHSPFPALGPPVFGLGKRRAVSRLSGVGEGTWGSTVL